LPGNVCRLRAVVLARYDEVVWHGKLGTKQHSLQQVDTAQIVGAVGSDFSPDLTEQTPLLWTG